MQKVTKVSGALSFWLASFIEIVDSYLIAQAFGAFRQMVVYKQAVYQGTIKAIYNFRYKTYKSYLFERE